MAPIARCLKQSQDIQQGENQRRIADQGRKTSDEPIYERKGDLA